MFFFLAQIPQHRQIITGIPHVFAVESRKIEEAQQRTVY